MDERPPQQQQQAPVVVTFPSSSRPMSVIERRVIDAAVLIAVLSLLIMTFLPQNSLAYGIAAGVGAFGIAAALVTWFAYTVFHN